MTPDLQVDVRPSGPPTIIKRDDKFHDALASQEGFSLPPATLAAYRKAKENADAAMASREPRPGDNVVVVALGTGGSVPATYRNGEL
jgi:hypothetical protein